MNAAIRKQEQYLIKGNLNVLTYKVRRKVELVELVGGLQDVGNQAGHQNFFSQLGYVGDSPLAAGHLDRPLVCVCDNADGLGNRLIQYRMLHRTNRIL